MNFVIILIMTALIESIVDWRCKVQENLGQNLSPLEGENWEQLYQRLHQKIFSSMSVVDCYEEAFIFSVSCFRLTGTEAFVEDNGDPERGPSRSLCCR